MDIKGLDEKLNLEETVNKNINNMTGWFNTFGAGYNIYAGTASPIKVAKRRAKNKVARNSRRKNR